MPMLRKISVLIAILILGACTQHYMIATNFHDHLRKGMTKQQFMEVWQNKNKNIVGGGCPTSSRNFTIGKDNWEILIYSVYEYSSVMHGNPRIDHHEYVAFKNGFLVEWGPGTIPLSLKTDPSVIHLESGQ